MFARSCGKCFTQFFKKRSLVFYGATFSYVIFLEMLLQTIFYWFIFTSYGVVFPVFTYLEWELYRMWDHVVSLVEDEPSVPLYDFIVVGAGSAGAVVANRLSKNNKVLLLDAGGDPLIFTVFPILAPELLGRTRITKKYKTVPQIHSQFLQEKRQLTWHRGQVLGGSSVINYALYVRGHPLDYENWANVTGDNSWNYEEVLPYFKKSLMHNSEYHGKERNYRLNPYGYLHVERNDVGNGEKNLYTLFRKAFHELGFQFQEMDLNMKQKSGFGPFETSTKRGWRHSTFSAFLKPILGRENLRILRYSYVTKVEIDSNQNARGVWFTRHGKTYFAKASKEIILSTGAVDSPKLLMLSGIGSKEHLKKIGVTCDSNRIVLSEDLPVGKGLKDHLSMLLTPFLINAPLTIHPEKDLGLKALFEYLVYGIGPLAFPCFLHSQAFLDTSLTKTVDWPNIQMYFGYYGIYEAMVDHLHRLNGINAEAFENYIGPYKGHHALSIAVNLVRPKSVGEILLASNDPHVDPIIDPRYLENPDDLRVYVEGMKFVLNLMENTQTFLKLNTTFAKGQLPGCEQHEWKSDAYLECYVRHFSFSIFHPVGTCKMGRAQGDPTAVVDPQLRVLKVKGLRVADASIMPEIVNGNTNAPTIMIGEKVADMIRQYWLDQNLISDKHTFTFRHKLYRTQCFYSRLV